LDAKQKLSQGESLNLNGPTSATAEIHSGELQGYATAYAEPIAYAEHVTTYDDKNSYY
jgi:hypothetical protein